MRKIGDKQRLSYGFVAQAFKDSGCELLSDEYFNGTEKLLYRCVCGNVATIGYQKFRAGQRCVKCKSVNASIRQRGSKATNYNHDRTDEQRVKDRKYPEYTEWRRAVYQRDDYTCQSCGERGKTLNAHHIQSYANHPELRTDVDNGVTLCYGCHNDYHRKIEHNTATLEGWRHYLSQYLDPPHAEKEDDCHCY